MSGYRKYGKVKLSNRINREAKRSDTGGHANVLNSTYINNSRLSDKLFIGVPEDHRVASPKDDKKLHIDLIII